MPRPWKDVTHLIQEARLETIRAHPLLHELEPGKAGVVFAAGPLEESKAEMIVLPTRSTRNYQYFRNRQSDAIAEIYQTRQNRHLQTSSTPKTEPGDVKIVETKAKHGMQPNDSQWAHYVAHIALPEISKDNYKTISENITKTEDAHRDAIKTGLQTLAKHIEEKGIKSIAIPLIGTERTNSLDEPTGYAFEKRDLIPLLKEHLPQNIHIAFHMADPYELPPQPPVNALATIVAPRHRQPEAPQVRNNGRDSLAMQLG
jgi:hypothetical protein